MRVTDACARRTSPAKVTSCAGKPIFGIFLVHFLWMIDDANARYGRGKLRAAVEAGKWLIWPIDDIIKLGLLILPKA
jgi:hypothetical protein